MFTRN